MDERRKFLRLNAKVSVTYQQADSTQESPTITRNIGAGGICILGSEAVALGKQIKVEIKLPEQGRIISFVGEVVWSGEVTLPDVASAPLVQMGVRFINIDPKDHQAIIRHCVTNI
jgi:c-di-GMP-binding flagellar brake protein YcgR